MVTTMKLLPICHSVPSTNENCNLTPFNFPQWCDSSNNFAPNTKPKCTRPHSRSIRCHKIHTRPLCGKRCRPEGSMNLRRGIHKEGDVGARHFHGQFGVFRRCQNMEEVHLHSGGNGLRGGVQFHGVVLGALHSKRGRCRRYLTRMDGIHNLWRIRTIK